MKVLTAGMLGSVLALVIAPAAMASTVTDAGGSRLNVTSSGNERNRIDIGYDGAAPLYVVTDAAGINANRSCAQISATTATCPGGGIRGISVSSSGGDDVVAVGPSSPASVNATLNGGSGNDILIGGPADDALAGSSGRDFLDGGPGADELRGGSGTDTASYFNRVEGVAVTVGTGHDDGNTEDQSGNQRDSVGGGVEIVLGGHGADLLIGDNSSETLVGGDDDDVLIGQRGADTLLGDAGNDFMLGGNGPDVLRGWIGDDRMRGDNGNDLLAGGPDDDVLKGGFGHDWLRGKKGVDRLYAKDGSRDLKINCGPAPNRLERVKWDQGLDPSPKSC